MKIAFLATLLAMLLPLPALGFSLGDLLNSTGKTDQPRQATGPDSATDSARSGAAVSDESAQVGQEGLADVDTFLKSISEQSQFDSGESEASSPDFPSNTRATGNGCKKNPETGVINC